MKIGDAVHCDDCEINFVSNKDLWSNLSCPKCGKGGFAFCIGPRVNGSYVGFAEGVLQETHELSGTKHDNGKSRVDLIEPCFMLGMGHVLQFGAEKYGEDNWRSGIKVRRNIGAAMRHILSYLHGQDKDGESGLSHLFHAAVDLMFAHWTVCNKGEFDDRYKD